jgi:hypothetical protein
MGQTMSQAVEVSQATRENIKEGVIRLAATVAPAFGPPLSKRVIAEEGIAFTDAEQTAAVRVLIDVALTTANVAGDGTGQTILLARRTVEEICAALAGAAPIRRP